MIEFSTRANSRQLASLAVIRAVAVVVAATRAVVAAGLQPTAMTDRVARAIPVQVMEAAGKDKQKLSHRGVLATYFLL